MANRQHHQGKETFYHYTDKTGAKGIASSGFIRGSHVSGPRDDAAFGDGAYLTKMSPAEGKYALAENNWDGNSRDVEKVVDSGKVDYFVKVEVDRRDVTQVKNADGRDIYLHRGDFNITKDMNPNLGKVPDY